LTSSLTAVRVGSQRPRVRSVPIYATSAGDEAADLARQAGLILDEWQRLALVDLLGERPDGKWAAFEGAVIVPRQNGKGAIIEARELFGLFLAGERLILHSAHEYKTAQEAFLRIKSLVDGSAELSRHVDAVREANGEQQIIMSRGCCKLHPLSEPPHRLRFVARSKASGRGFSGDVNMLDEAYALTRTQLAALMPTMSARPNPQILYFSTPPDEDTSPLPDEAVLPSVRERGLLGGARLAYLEWSPPDDEPYDPADPDVLYMTNPAAGIRIFEDFAEAELAALGPAKYCVERLGAWPGKGNEWRVIPRADWLAAADPASTLVDPVAMAAVVSADRTWCSIVAAGARSDGLLHVEVVARIGIGDALARIQSLTDRWSPCAWVIDEGGPSKSLAEAVEAAGIELTKPTMRDVAGAAGALYDAVAGRPQYDPATGELGADPRLVRWTCTPELEPAFTGAVAGAVKRPLAAGWAWDQLAAAVDLAPLIGASNALWGYQTRPPEEPTVTPWAWRG
jgi:hypothetical protein